MTSSRPDRVPDERGLRDGPRSTLPEAQPTIATTPGPVSGHPSRREIQTVARNVFRMAMLMARGRAAPGGLALRGRRDECAVLDRLRERARAGRSGVLVIRGEAGVGKTALLDYAIASASDVLVVRASGVESEMELAFAVLHQLCVPLLDRLEWLPVPQRHALEITFRLSEGAVPDRLFVGLAVLGLLSEAAQERPLVCVIDDAQWLDRASAQALAFVARRLLADPVVMLFAVREPGHE